MAVDPRAGKPATKDMLIDVPRLEQAYYDGRPDAADPRQEVKFGTSGHRGTPLDDTFTEAHILAITQAICDYRAEHGITGPLFLGRDTHAISGPAQQTTLEVLAANQVETFIQRDDAATPTPVISHAIVTYNRGRGGGLADGVVITPSHNPPEDGGYKYNPPHGGPTDSAVTRAIERRANAILIGGNHDVRRFPLESALRAVSIHLYDYVTPYVRDLAGAIDMEAIRSAGLKLGVDPLGGAALGYWDPICEQYGLNIEVVNRRLDPTFSFMPVDHDGKIRMDCSSPYAMANLVAMKDRFQVAFGNDPDSDRHGIVTPTAGLMNPNHYLAVAIRYLLEHRPQWPAGAAVGKTLVSSGIIDRVVDRLKRQLREVPVGFKWFAAGLHDSSYCFGGEESAVASFLRRDGTVWTTDKDGPLLDLLAAEIIARTGKDPGEHYVQITSELGDPRYRRVDAPATAQQRARLNALVPDDIRASQLAGEPILSKLTRAPGNNAPIGGLKVVAANGWFAVRPSGTEDISKIYAESFKGESHLSQIIAEAQQIVDDVLRYGQRGTEKS